MRCTPMKLHEKNDTTRTKLTKNSDDQTIFYTEKNYGYSLNFVKKLIEVPRDFPTLSIKTINPPENMPGYNTGCSLEKWSKKKPRLKSANKKIQTNIEVLDENAYDITEILDSLDNLLPVKEDSYEINSDIEELWRKSQNGGDSYREKHRKKHKKYKKCIKFSLSKPVSPQTEQVIRVDVSSTVSIDNLIKKEKMGKNQKGDKKSSKNQEDFITCNQLSIKTR